MPRGIPKNKNPQPQAGYDVTHYVRQVQNLLTQVGREAFNQGVLEERARFQRMFAGGGGAAPAQTPAKAKPAAKAVKPPAPKKTRKNPWNSMTPEQREARLAALAAGRAKRHGTVRDGSGSTLPSPLAASEGRSTDEEGRRATQGVGGTPESSEGAPTQHSASEAIPEPSSSFLG